MRISRQSEIYATRNNNLILLLRGDGEKSGEEVNIENLWRKVNMQIIES